MTDITEIDDRIVQAVEKAENGAQIYHDIANNPAGSYIETESGPLPSVAEWLRVNSEALGGVPGLLEFVTFLAEQNDTSKGAGKIGWAGTDLGQYLISGVEHSLPSIAAMRLVKPGLQKTIRTAGFYGPNDGGDSFYTLVEGDFTTPESVPLVIRTNANERYRLVPRMNGISVKQCGAKGIGSTFDDSPAFLLCANLCMADGLKMLVPAVANFYNLSTGIPLDQKIIIEGEAGGPVNVYSGKQMGGSRIHYTGNGDCFSLDTVQDPAKRGIEGSTWRNLTIIGTAAAKHAIRVGKASDIDVANKVKSNIIIDNVYVGDFKTGRALAITWCFSNTVRDFVAQNCGCCVSLYYAHATRFQGGNLEQSLVGLDSRVSFGVVLDGTVLQGMDDTRQTTFSLAVPSDFFIWAGWDGSGTTGATRTTPAGYAGTCVRNLGSAIGIEGSDYWEYFNYGVLMEADSHTTIMGGIVGLDPICKAFIQIGIGALCVENVEFQGGGHAGFMGVYQTERNYAAPCKIGEANVYGTTIPRAKVFVGPQSHVGRTSQWDPATFSMASHDYNVFHNEGQSPAPNVTASSTVNLFTYALSNKIRQIITAASTVTYVFTDPESRRAQAGAKLCLHVIASAASTVSFSTANFRSTAASYAMPANTQAIYEFEFSNGFWIMKTTPAIVSL